MLAAHISYRTNDSAFIFPITPSSPMGEEVDAWAEQQKKNLWGQELKVVEMQSEGGAAGALHGALVSGALARGYTYGTTVGRSGVTCDDMERPTTSSENFISTPLTCQEVWIAGMGVISP